MRSCPYNGHVMVLDGAAWGEICIFLTSRKVIPIATDVEPRLISMSCATQSFLRELTISVHGNESEINQRQEKFSLYSKSGVRQEFKKHSYMQGVGHCLTDLGAPI